MAADTGLRRIVAQHGLVITGMGCVTDKTFSPGNRLVQGLFSFNTLLVTAGTDLPRWNGRCSIAGFLVTGGTFPFLHRVVYVFFQQTRTVAAMGRMTENTLPYTLIPLMGCHKSRFPGLMAAFTECIGFLG